MPYLFKRLSRLILVSITTLPFIVNATDNVDFEQCIDGMKTQATTAGFSEHIINDVIPALSPIERVITLDQRQPEFSQSFADYLDFLQSNPRYATALNNAQNPNDFAHSLQAAGYATDPYYANKIMSLYNSGVIQDAKLDN